MIELTVLNDSNVELNTVDDGLIGLDVVMATGGGTPTLQTKSVNYTPTESTQTDSVTPDVGYDGLSEVDVTVGAINSYYVGSDIPRNTSSSLLTEGATVIAPSGYYENSATKTVQMGTAGTPTASKGAVSNHSVSVTPSVTNQAGYIYSETKTGTAVSVSASELVSGTKSVTQNGTEDVTNYASVSVSVPNSYSASDEGKVVDNGALVAQTSATYTTNNTYDTTLINEVTVNVSGGGVDDPTDFTGGNILAIKGHGTEYIITDIYPNFVGVYATKLADNTVNNYEYYWGALGTNTAYLCLQRNGTGNTITVKGMGSVSISYTGFSSGNIVTPVFSSIGMAEPATKNKPLAIGRGYYNGKIETQIAIYTFYGLNILNSNFEYTYRFVPWLDNGVACIKELISGTIYHNSGTGAYDYIDLEGVFHNA